FSYPFPFKAASRAVGALVNGWTLDGIGTFSSGKPFSPRLTGSVSRDGSGASGSERPNLNAGFSNNPSNGVSAGCAGIAAGTPLHNAKNWYDPCAFSNPAGGNYGNLGRNTVIGPGLENVDLALAKTFKIGETAGVTFRTEMFNIM